jgi:hypothetical protein
VRVRVELPPLEDGGVFIEPGENLQSQGRYEN